MRIDNPLRMNDWPLKRFLAAILGYLLVLWSVLGLGFAGIELPFIRQVIAIPVLFFLPGICILRLLKLRDLCPVRILVYSVGLSVTVVSLTGLVCNSLLPLGGMETPITLLPIYITLTLVLLSLSLAAVVRNHGEKDAGIGIDIKNLFSIQHLCLLLLLVLSVLGGFLQYYLDNNTVLLLFVGLVALTVLIIGFTELIPRNLYPFVVFILSLSLLLHYASISPFLIGSDVHDEFRLANQVVYTGFWDATVPEAYNSVLSITLLAPVTSIAMDIDIITVFKYIYPLLLAVAPMGLYWVYRKQTGDRTAFFSCFFLILFSEFYFELGVIPRQQIATLFFALLLLLVVDPNLGNAGRSVLFLVFSFSLVTAHYGLSYIYLFFLVAWAVYIGAGKIGLRRILTGLYSRFPHNKGEVSPYPDSMGDTLNPVFIVLFFTFAFVWYLYASSSVIFTTYIQFGEHIVRNMLSGLFDPEASHTWSLLLTQPRGALHLLHIIINYVWQGLTVLGFFVLFFRFNRYSFKKEYFAFSAFSMVFLFIGVFVAPLTASFSMYRLYFLVLPVLAPLAILGAIEVGRILVSLFRKKWSPGLSSVWAGLVSVFLAVFFLFQSGFIWEISGENWTSVPLSRNSIYASGDDDYKAWLYGIILTDQEAAGAEWLSQYKENQSTVYANWYDNIRVRPLASYAGMTISEMGTLRSDTETIPGPDYIYLQYLNVHEGIGVEFNRLELYGHQISLYGIENNYSLFTQQNRIYVNNGSEIYR